MCTLCLQNLASYRGFVDFIESLFILYLQFVDFNRTEGLSLHLKRKVLVGFSSAFLQTLMAAFASTRHSSTRCQQDWWYRFSERKRYRLLVEKGRGDKKENLSYLWWVIVEHFGIEQKSLDSNFKLVQLGSNQGINSFIEKLFKSGLLKCISI